jgi:cytoskeletal protein CcmA (bactofilin family)
LELCNFWRVSGTATAEKMVIEGMFLISLLDCREEIEIGIASLL